MSGNEDYKKYEKIKQSDALNLPYFEHKWANVKEYNPNMMHINYKTICKTKHLGGMAYDKHKKRFYFTDRRESLLKYVDDDLNVPVVQVDVDDDIAVHRFHGINPRNLLKHPVAICINSLGHMFIGDHGDFRNNDTKGIIYIFDSDLAFINEITHPEIKTPSCMDIENINSNESSFRLYVTDWLNNNLTVWNLEYNRTYQCKHMRTVVIITPSSIKIKDNLIVVISEITLVWANDEYKSENIINFKRTQVKRITSGLNAIILFDKIKFEEIRTIELMNWLNPRGLFIDDQSRIYTTAYKLLPFQVDSFNNRQDLNDFKNEYFKCDEQTTREHLISLFHSQMYNNRDVSYEMFLIVLDKNGEILLQTNLGFEYIGDFYVLENENKIVFMSRRADPALHVLEFTQESQFIDS